MNWIVKKLFKQPAHDLELVARGIDHAFFLFFLSSLLLLATMLIEAAFSIPIWKWALPSIIVLGLVGTVLIGYRIGSKAIRAAWVLGVVPFVFLFLVLVIYGTFSNDPPPKGIWTVIMLTIMTSLGGSIAGSFQDRIRRKKATSEPK